MFSGVKTKTKETDLTQTLNNMHNENEEETKKKKKLRASIKNEEEEMLLNNIKPNLQAVLCRRDLTKKEPPILNKCMQLDTENLSFNTGEHNALFYNIQSGTAKSRLPRGRLGNAY